MTTNAPTTLALVVALRCLHVQRHHTVSVRGIGWQKGAWALKARNCWLICDRLQCIELINRCRLDTRPVGIYVTNNCNFYLNERLFCFGADWFLNDDSNFTSWRANWRPLGTFAKWSLFLLNCMFQNRFMLSFRHYPWQEIRVQYFSLSIRWNSFEKDVSTYCLFSNFLIMTIRKFWKKTEKNS